MAEDTVDTQGGKEEDSLVSFSPELRTGTGLGGRDRRQFCLGNKVVGGSWGLGSLPSPKLKNLSQTLFKELSAV